jgi:hypothetical protein
MVHKSSKLYLGMDVREESIDIAVADEGGEVRPPMLGPAWRRYPAASQRAGTSLAPCA